VATPAPLAAAPPPAERPLDLGQLQEAWQRSVLPAIASTPTQSLFLKAKPVLLEDERLVIEFAPGNDFHRKLAEDERNLSQLREALHQVTGRKLALEFTLGTAAPETEPDAEPEVEGEEELVSLLKDTFDAREVDD
jgi:hypothetical protein